MKLTESMYRLLCKKYQTIIDNSEQRIVQYTQELIDDPEINNSSVIVDEITIISETRDKLEALKDFWIHQKNS